MGSSGRRNHSSFFSQFVASNDSNGSSLNHGFLRNSNLNDNRYQNQGLSPIIPLQTPRENRVGSTILNSFQPKRSWLQNSAIDRFAGSSNSANLLQNSLGHLAGSENSEPGKSLLQNSSKGLYAGSDIVNQLQTRAKNRWGSLILNSFSPVHLYAGSDSANHSSSPGQILSNNVTENLWGPKIPKKILSKQLFERPIVKPGQLLSYKVNEILSGLNVPKRLPSELLLEKPNEKPNQPLPTNVTENLSGSKISRKLLSEQLLEGPTENPGQLLPCNVTGNLSGPNVPPKVPSEQLPERPVENRSQLLLNNVVTENLWGPDIPKTLPSEQSAGKPIENPKQENPRTQKISEAIHEFLPEKDDYTLSFVYQEGLRYCAKAKKTEEITSNTNTNYTSGPLAAEPSSKAMDQGAKGSLKIIELLKQNLPWSRRKRKRSGQNIGQPEKKLQVGSSSTPGDKEETDPTYNNATPSLLAAALTNRSDQNPSDPPITSSVSPPTIARENGDPIRSRARPFPEKLHEENHHESSSYNVLDSNMELKGMLSGTSLYHGASRLSTAGSTVDSNNNWQTVPPRRNPEAETQKWQNKLVGSSNVKGIADEQFSSFFSRLNSQSIQTTLSSSSAPKKETAKHAPSSPIPMVAKALNSTSESQINGNGKNQQIEQLMSVIQAPTQQSRERIFTKQVPHQNSKQTEAPVTFYRGGSQTKEHALENLGTKIETLNRSNLKVGEKEFERMVNWPEHHLMGTDRFGFDV